MCAQMVEQGAFHGALSKSSWICFLSRGTFETCLSSATIGSIKQMNNAGENACIFSLLLNDEIKKMDCAMPRYVWLIFHGCLRYTGKTGIRSDVENLLLLGQET